MPEWVEVVDPRWAYQLQELGQAQNYTLFTKQWWISKHKLGYGGFSKVFWVQRREGSLNFPHAAKVVESRQPHTHDSHRSREHQMWAVEWHIHKQVSGHPNIVQLLDAYYTEQTPAEKARMALIMELGQPHDLEEFIRHYADVNIWDATLWILHMCTGLEHLHSHSIMHRDVKPGNCLLFHRPLLSPMLKLGDMGAAAVLAQKGEIPAPAKQQQGPGSPTTGATTQALQHDLTTFQYAAPEVLRHENYDFSADIWGVGVICWEMLQADPRQPALDIENPSGPSERLAAMAKFQSKVEAQGVTAPETPLLHVAWCMLQEPAKRPSATSALEFAAFASESLGSPTKEATDSLGAGVPQATKDSPNSGVVQATVPKPDKNNPQPKPQCPPEQATAKAAAEAAATGDPQVVAQEQATAEIAAAGGPGAASLQTRKQALDVVVAMAPLMPSLLPGDIPAFNAVMQQYHVNADVCFACWGVDACR